MRHSGWWVYLVLAAGSSAALSPLLGLVVGLVVWRLGRERSLRPRPRVATLGRSGSGRGV